MEQRGLAALVPSGCIVSCSSIRFEEEHPMETSTAVGVRAMADWREFRHGIVEARIAALREGIESQETR